MEDELRNILYDWFEEEPSDSVIEWLLDEKLLDRKALKAALLKHATEDRAEAKRHESYGDIELRDLCIAEAEKAERAARTL